MQAVGAISVECKLTSIETETPMVISPLIATASQQVQPEYVARLLSKANMIRAEAERTHVEALEIFVEAAQLDLEAGEYFNEAVDILRRKRHYRIFPYCNCM